MSLPFLFTDGVMTVLAAGKQYQVRDTDPEFKKVKEAVVKGNARDVVNLLDKPKVIAKAAKTVFKTAAVVVENGEVKVNGEVVHNTVTKRILDFAERGLPITPLMNFLARVQANPSATSQKELYDFLEHRGLPINSEGFVLGYKAVRSDFLDKYTGTIDNSVGKTVEMPRPKVDDNRANHCSFGLHVGALDYVTWYGRPDNGDKIIILEFDPADAVSVPSDHNFMKLRVCKYKVIGLFEGELLEPVYNVSEKGINKWEPSAEDVDDMYDPEDVESYDDDEDDELLECENCGETYEPYDGYDEFCSEYCCDEWHDHFGDEENEDDLNEVLPDNGKCCRGDCGTLGTKPNGQGFHNLRDHSGRFAPKN